MVNSIRDALDEGDTISEIHLTIAHDSKKVCVIVEGEDDYRLFSPLLLENVEIFQSYSSCTGVDNIVQHHFLGYKRVIGIRDRDYLSEPVNDQCFFCDYCCAEMMIIAVDQCFDRLFANTFSNNGPMNSDKVRLYCLERLEKLSKLRKMSCLLGWNIKFDGIKPANYYKNDIGAMNSDIVEKLNLINPNNQIDADRQRICDDLPKCTSLSEYLQITNGHDFVNLFCKVATVMSGQVAIKTIETALRTTFSIGDFKRTNLYNDLHKYQVDNNIRIVE